MATAFTSLVVGLRYVTLSYVKSEE